MAAWRRFSPYALSLALHGTLGGAFVLRGSENKPADVTVDRWSGALLLSVDITPPAPASEDLSEASASPAIVELPIRARSKPRPLSPRTSVDAQRDNSDATASTTASSAAAAGIPALDAVPPGGADLPPGVRSLATAVTRALPKAAELDPIWFELPIGSLGALRVQFTTDAEGSLLTTEILDLDHTPPVLREVLKRTFLFLRNGLFAVDPSHLGAGTQTLLIRGELRQRASNDNELALPQHTFVMHQVSPTRGRPGLAYVTFNSGRHVEFSIALE